LKRRLLHPLLLSLNRLASLIARTEGIETSSLPRHCLCQGPLASLIARTEGIETI